MLVKDLMKKPLVIEKDASLKKAAELMKKNNINSLIMVNGSKIKGLITRKDLTNNFGSNKKISQTMLKRVITVYDNDNVTKAIELIKNKNIGILPVVDKEDNLVGVISTKDLLIYACEASDFLIE